MMAYFGYVVHLSTLTFRASDICCSLPCPHILITNMRHMDGPKISLAVGPFGDSLIKNVIILLS